MTTIATILTVHNRKQKTLSCLNHLYEALDTYNKRTENKLRLTIFLTDDGSTDGTAEAVSETFTLRDIHILKGSGSLFWAGGMRLAWQTAMAEDTKWDYFLLLNDDTDIFSDAFFSLFTADEYALRQSGRRGIVSGITCEKGNQQHVTYGGFNFVDNNRRVYTLGQPTGKPQKTDLAHANILLIHHSVAEKVGLFYKGYIHSCADHDYSLEAQRHHFPVYLTGCVCGECTFDHDTPENEIRRLERMTLKERKQYLSIPTHSDNDYLLLVKRQFPRRYPVTYLLRAIRLYWPHAYYLITKSRGVYNER